MEELVNELVVLLDLELPIDTDTLAEKYSVSSETVEAQLYLLAPELKPKQQPKPIKLMETLVDDNVNYHDIEDTKQSLEKFKAQVPPPKIYVPVPEDADEQITELKNNLIHSSVALSQKIKTLLKEDLDAKDIVTLTKMLTSLQSAFFKGDPSNVTTVVEVNNASKIVANFKDKLKI